MSPQVSHALKQAAIMMFIAALGAAAQDQTHVLTALNINPVWWPVIGASFAAVVRWAEGLRDADRAAIGDIKPADVGYAEVAAARQDSVYV